MTTDFAGVATFTYLSLCAFSGYQTCRILCYSRHDVRSFQVAFLVLVFVWAFLRALFFVYTWSTFTLLVLFWVPMDIQFATFSLLIVSYAHLVHRNEWNFYKTVYLALYTGTNCCVVALTATYVSVALTATNVQITQHLKEMHHVLMAIQTGLLIILYISCTYKINTSRALGSVRRLTALSVLCVVLFSFRWSYDILAACTVLPFVDLDTWEIGKNPLQVHTFALLLAWAVVPAFTVLVFLRSIPNTKVRWSWRCCVWCKSIDSAPLSNVSSGSSPFQSRRYYGSMGSSTTISESSTPLLLSPSTLKALAVSPGRYWVPHILDTNLDSDFFYSRSNSPRASKLCFSSPRSPRNFAALGHV
jgi:hypothetical protein